MTRFPISLLLFLLLLGGCEKPVFTKFIIQYKSPELLQFYESGARTVVFPVMTKAYSVLDFNASAKEAEDFIRASQGHLTLIPFDEVLGTVSDSNALEPLIRTLNGFYKKGEVDFADASRLAAVASQYEPRFFLFLKLTNAELYRDLKKNYKIQLTITGKLYSLKSNSMVLSFVCASFSRSAEKSGLPALSEIVQRTLKEMADDLPYDPEKALRQEKGADW